MTEVNTEQTVVEETKVPAQPGTEATSARETDDLDALLSEYDKGTKSPEPTPGQKVVAAQDVNVLAEKVKTLGGAITQVSQFRYKQDMDKTIRDIRGDIDPEFADNDLVESWLDAQARKDPRLAKAWMDRDANPKQFEKVKIELAKNFSKKFLKLSQFDKEATDTREIVAAAVRGASTNKAPEQKPPKYGEMPNNEFRQEVKKQFGFDPGV